jgi:hypothetical protein
MCYNIICGYSNCSTFTAIYLLMPDSSACTTTSNQWNWCPDPCSSQYFPLLELYVSRVWIYCDTAALSVATSNITPTFSAIAPVCANCKQLQFYQQLPLSRCRTWYTLGKYYSIWDLFTPNSGVCDTTILIGGGNLNVTPAQFRCLFVQTQP